MLENEVMEFNNAQVAPGRHDEAWLRQRIRDDADRCVKCGLCLPRCPTYALSGREAESPRGRIALLQHLAETPEAVDDSLTTAIDHCLSCRACEAVCPAQVPYGRLFDRGQALLARRLPARRRRLRRRAWLLQRPRLRRALLRPLWLAQSLGALAAMRRLLRRTGVGRLLQRLPDLPWPRDPREAPAGTRCEVAIFSGCLGDSADQRAVDALRGLLEAAGYDARVPRGQVCCGALQAHGGDPAAANAAVAANAAALSGARAIAPVASGCAAWLQDSAQRHDTAETHPRPTALTSPWRLLCARQERLRWRAGAERVALWTACTQRNVLRDDAALRELLAAVPEATIAPLTSESGCCGAAGMHFLDEPERADALVAPLVAALRAQRPDVLLCANVGCRMHIAQALRRAGLTLPVQHPAEWLRDRLSPAAPP